MKKRAGLADRQHKQPAPWVVSSALLLAVALLLAMGSLTVASAAAETSASRGHTEYRPPPIDLAPRRIGGGLRSTLPSLPTVAALVPDHLGLTRAAQPVLYWFISAPTAMQIEFTLIRPGIETPLVERTLAARTSGVQRVDLAALGVRLQPGIEYEWLIALVPDTGQRSRDVVAGGAILRVDHASEPALDAGSAASAGYWYDALMALEASDDRLGRAALLEQAGMPDVADHERAR